MLLSAVLAGGCRHRTCPTLLHQWRANRSTAHQGVPAAHIRRIANQRSTAHRLLQRRCPQGCPGSLLVGRNALRLRKTYIFGSAGEAATTAHLLAWVAPVLHSGLKRASEQFHTLEAVHTGLDGGKTSACAPDFCRTSAHQPKCLLYHKHCVDATTWQLYRVQLERHELRSVGLNSYVPLVCFKFNSCIIA